MAAGGAAGGAAGRGAAGGAAGGGAAADEGGALVARTRGAIVVAAGGAGAVAVDDGDAAVWVALVSSGAFVGVDDPVELQAAKPIDNPMVMMASARGAIEDIARSPVSLLAANSKPVCRSVRVMATQRSRDFSFYDKYGQLREPDARC